MLTTRTGVMREQERRRWGKAWWVMAALLVAVAGAPAPGISAPAPMVGRAVSAAAASPTGHNVAQPARREGTAVTSGPRTAEGRLLTAAPSIGGVRTITAPSTIAPSCVVQTGVSDRCPRWVSAGDGDGTQYEPAPFVALSPAGDVMYSARTVPDPNLEYAYNILAVRQGSGERLWSVTGVRFGDAKLAGDVAGIAVDPGGRYVVVVGTMVPAGGGTGTSIGTVAYDARTGHQLWAVQQFLGQSGAVAGVGISSDSRTVYVSGTKVGLAGASWLVAAAYDAANGDQLWFTQYAPVPTQPQQGGAGGGPLAISTDGSLVFVAGADQGVDSSDAVVNEALVVALDARTGTRRWMWRQPGPHCSHDSPFPTNPCGSSPARAGVLAIAVGPDGADVYVAADVNGSALTAALSSRSGHEIWSQQRSAQPLACGCSLMVGRPDGHVYVVDSDGPGTTGACSFCTGARVTSYNGGTGTALWSATLNGAIPTGGAVAPDGHHIFLVGAVGDGSASSSVTSLDTTAGAQVWTSLYQPACGFIKLTAVAVTGDSRQVDVAGYTQCYTDSSANQGPQWPETVAAYDAS